MLDAYKAPDLGQPALLYTGNTPGYTQFVAASPTGSRSVTVSINSQLAPPVGDPDAFKALRRAEGLAVCAALAGKG